MHVRLFFQWSASCHCQVLWTNFRIKIHDLSNCIKDNAPFSLSLSFSLSFSYISSMACQSLGTQVGFENAVASKLMNHLIQLYISTYYLSRFIYSLFWICKKILWSNHFGMLWRAWLERLVHCSLLNRDDQKQFQYTHTKWEKKIEWATR